MKKEFTVSQVEDEGVLVLANMDDFTDRIECSNDEYWSSVEGQVFNEDEFKVENDIAYPIINTLNDF